MRRSALLLALLSALVLLLAGCVQGVKYDNQMKMSACPHSRLTYAVVSRSSGRVLPRAPGVGDRQRKRGRGSTPATRPGADAAGRDGTTACRHDEDQV